MRIPTRTLTKVMDDIGMGKQKIVWLTIGLLGAYVVASLIVWRLDLTDQLISAAVCVACETVLAIWVWFDHRSTQNAFGDNVIGSDRWLWIVGVFFCVWLVVPWYLVRRQQQRQPSSINFVRLPQRVGRYIAGKRS